MAGLIIGPGMSAYSATKHAVVAISETMYHEFAAIGSKVGCSVLCPGWVNTRIPDSDRNRPSELSQTSEFRQRPEYAAVDSLLRQLISTGMPPAEVAEHVFSAVRENRFWILTHESFRPLVSDRFKHTVSGTNPVYIHPSDVVQRAARGSDVMAELSGDRRISISDLRRRRPWSYAILQFECQNFWRLDATPATESLYRTGYTRRRRLCRVRSN